MSAATPTAIRMDNPSSPASPRRSKVEMAQEGYVAFLNAKLAKFSRPLCLALTITVLNLIFFVTMFAVLMVQCPVEEFSSLHIAPFGQINWMIKNDMIDCLQMVGFLYYDTNISFPPQRRELEEKTVIPDDLQAQLRSLAATGTANTPSPAAHPQRGWGHGIYHSLLFLQGGPEQLGLEVVRKPYWRQQGEDRRVADGQHGHFLVVGLPILQRG
ncbi:unnamed protein product [Amoebophrya sp. A120]|nr:unnamed protein product [Amoebophrya sp. A120]|eukprot:GSA120T00007153001.1